MKYVPKIPYIADYYFKHQSSISISYYFETLTVNRQGTNWNISPRGPKRSDETTDTYHKHVDSDCL